MTAHLHRKPAITAKINTALRHVPVWAVYALGVVPAFWFIWRGIENELGPNPISKLEHLLGEFALQLLILGLAITPLRRFLSVNLLKFRRAISLLAFFYIVLHLLVWLILDVGVLSEIWADITKRPYITTGMLSFVCAVPLALTSNNWALRKLGKGWYKLHKLVYLICLLAGVHFVMLRKGLQLQPLLYLASICLLLGLRLIPKNR